MRSGFLALVAVCALAVALAGRESAPAAGVTLYGNVGPGYVISLTDAAGAPVTRLATGTYTIVVNDQASNHNFHLVGPGVDQSTSVSFVGQVTWTVTLSAGTYQFVCDPHVDGMVGSFTVVAPDTTPPETSITAGPSGTVNSTAASFTFSSTEAGSTFECALDGAAFSPCTSPKSYSGLSSGGHSFQVRATDAAGNVDPTPAGRNWTVDTQPPETTITDGPSGTGGSSSATFSFSSSEPGGSFQCSLDGSPFAVCSSPKAYTGLASASHTFRVRALDAAGNVDPTAASRTWTVDVVPPETTITSGPSGLVTSSQASFEFVGETGARFECALDGAAFASCTSPRAYSGLADGAHSFQVRAVDLAGNADPTPAASSWTIDTGPPETTIDNGPSGMIVSTSATFEFSSSEAGSSFECSLDGAPFVACSSPQAYSGLAEGGHSFQVRAVDAAGNADPTPARRTWSVAGADATPPETTIDVQPPDPDHDPSPSFSFSASEASAVFECALDGAAFAPCTSPQAYARLADGAHTFQVRATDTAGNTDPAPAGHRWTIDTVPPETAIDAGPSGTVGSASASFEFSASETGASFECSLDGATFAACSSPRAYDGLATGPHDFQVRAVDAAGNTDPNAAGRVWTVGFVDTEAPETTIVGRPPDLDNSASAGFEFAASEPDASFECSLDAAAFGPCSSPKHYASLAEGDHTFQVRAADAAGNVDPTPAAVTWAIDATPPETAIDAGPAGTVISGSATFSFSASEAGSTFECSLDGGTFGPCSSPQSYDSLPDGEHSFRARAVDAARNVDSTPAGVTWTIDATPPETTIDTGPTGSVGPGPATFTFSSSEPGSSLACSLDGSAFAGCTSPVSYDGLPAGAHAFGVRAVDAAGNADPTPAARTWTVAPPAVQLIATGLSFNVATLSAPAGTVTLTMFNGSSIPHNIAIRGNGIDVAGPVVPKDGTSSVTAELAPGTYEFYCSVPGHAEAGMKGTLVVTGDGASTPPTTAPATPGTTDPAAETKTAGVAGVATPPPLRATCTGLTFTLKGTFASVAPSLRSMALRVERVEARSARARKRARSYVGKQVAVLLQPKTEVRRRGRPAAFADLVRGDRLSARVRLCKVAGRQRPVAGVLAAQPGASSEGALQLTATGIRFDKTALEARAGRVTITMWNTSPLEHDVAIRGRGIDVKGKLVARGGTSTVTATLAPGRYEFYCSVPGHAEAGMKGTLTVTP